MRRLAPTPLPHRAAADPTSLTRRSFTSNILRTLLTLVTLLAVGGLGACDEGPTSTTGGTAGNYVLQQVNGRALPVTLGQEVWEAMSMTLTSDRTITGTLRWREINASGTTVDQGTDTFSGTYAVNGDRLTITIADDDPAQAVLDGDRLTVTQEENTLVFRRQ